MVVLDKGKFLTLCFVFLSGCVMSRKSDSKIKSGTAESKVDQFSFQNIPRFKGSECVSGYKIGQAGFSQEAFKSLLVKDGKLTVSDVNDLPALLPEELHSIFVFESKSARIVSEKNENIVTPNNPRVILFDKSGQFRLAYSGCPEGVESDSCNVIEWQYFNHDTGFTEFRELDLKETAAEKIQNSFSETPKTCKKCHVADIGKLSALRPVWDPYNTWPGTYGSLERLNGGVIWRDSQEGKNYINFVKKVWQNPDQFKRYTKLKWMYSADDMKAFAKTSSDNWPNGYFGEAELVKKETLKQTVQVLHQTSSEEANALFSSLLVRVDAVRSGIQMLEAVVPTADKEELDFNDENHSAKLAKIEKTMFAYASGCFKDSSADDLSKVTGIKVVNEHGAGNEAKDATDTFVSLGLLSENEQQEIDLKTWKRIAEDASVTLEKITEQNSNSKYTEALLAPVKLDKNYKPNQDAIFLSTVSHLLEVTNEHFTQSNTQKLRFTKPEYSSESFNSSETLYFFKQALKSCDPYFQKLDPETMCSVLKKEIAR